LSRSRIAVSTLKAWGMMCSPIAAVFLLQKDEIDDDQHDRRCQ
jgi:hypothetical protein